MNTHNFNKLLITPEKEGRPGKHEIRIITYNIHSCVDKSRNVNPEIIAEIIETSRADIVCLQEVDEHRLSSQNTNQAKILADR
ncbi:MAG: endonuclease/exonuclease/phosphatase family protein, partial [Desulfobacterales bacterium]